MLMAGAVVAPPPVMVWVWEWKGDLNWVNPKTTGVAFLAAHFLVDQKGQMKVLPRREPFRVPAGTYEMAVIRLDVATEAKEDVWKPRFLQGVEDVITLTNPRALQIDFDARQSQGEMYRRLLTDLRARTQGKLFLSMTALVSWCGPKTWIKDLPVDEIVPMAFREPQLKRVEGCSESLGVNDTTPAKARRLYVFHEAWKPIEDLRKYVGAIP